MQWKTMLRFGVVSALAIAIGAPAIAEIEEIVVTATKREESVQDVPIAVTAISDVQLERAGIKDIRDLTTLAPSFNMNSSQTESQGTTLRIRGVGTTGNNIGLESAVGVFLDGVYLSRPGVALGDLLDVEQIEVLRGPQGTLFGRNTSAGALNVKTKKPRLEETEYWANASYGNFSFVNVQAGANVPINDTMALRVSGAYRERDGFLDSVTGAESNNRDRYLLRAQLLWQPNEDLSVRLIADYSDADEHCCDAPVILETPNVGRGAYATAGLPFNGGVSVFGSGALDSLTSNAEQFENPFEQWGFSVEVNYAVSDDATLVYIGSYRDFNAESVQHSDFVSLAVFDVPDAFDDIKSHTHELRLQGSTDRVDWMVGFFYADEEIEEIATLQLGSDYSAYISASAWHAGISALAGAALDGVPLPLGGTFGAARTSPNAAAAFANGATFAGDFARNRYTQESQSWSIFTHNTIRLADSWDLVVGLRYISEQKDGAYNQIAASSPGCENTLTNATGVAAFSPAIAGFAVAFACFPFSTRVDIGNPIFATPTSFDNEFKDNELTYTLKLVYSITDDINSYASLTHGFKAGGFNLDATAAQGGGDPRFDSETVDAYEIGVKALLLDNTLRLNFAAFHMEMDDFQVLEFTGVRFQTFNVARVLATGAEVEALWQPIDQLSVLFSLTYSDARYPFHCEGVAANPAAQVLSLCGFPLTNSSEFRGVLGLTWEDNLPGTEWSYFLNGTWQHESDRRTSTQPLTGLGGTLNPGDMQEDNSKVNARIGFTSPDGRYTVELWGQNVFDKQTKNVTFNVPLRGVGSFGEAARGVFIEAPRTYGVTLRFKF